LTITALQAAVLNCKLPPGVKLVAFDRIADDCNFEVESDGEDHISIGLNKPTSRQANLLQSKNREIFRREKEKYSSMTAVSFTKI